MNYKDFHFGLEKNSCGCPFTYNHSMCCCRHGFPSPSLKVHLSSFTPKIGFLFLTAKSSQTYHLLRCLLNWCPYPLCQLETCHQWRLSLLFGQFPVLASVGGKLFLQSLEFHPWVKKLFHQKFIQAFFGFEKLETIEKVRGILILSIHFFILFLHSALIIKSLA